MSRTPLQSRARRPRPGRRSPAASRRRPACGAGTTAAVGSYQRENSRKKPSSAADQRDDEHEVASKPASSPSGIQSRVRMTSTTSTARTVVKYRDHRPAARAANRERAGRRPRSPGPGRSTTKATPPPDDAGRQDHRRRPTQPHPAACSSGSWNRTWAIGGMSVSATMTEAIKRERLGEGQRLEQLALGPDHREDRQEADDGGREWPSARAGPPRWPRGRPPPAGFRRARLRRGA